MRLGNTLIYIKEISTLINTLIHIKEISTFQIIKNIKE